MPMHSPPPNRVTSTLPAEDALVHARVVRNPFLDFTVKGFRCFRDAAAFRDCRKINILSGPNNSGKSTLMLVLRRLTSAFHQPIVPYRGVAHLGGDTIDDLHFPPEDETHGFPGLEITFHSLLKGTQQAMAGEISLFRRPGRIHQLELRALGRSRTPSDQTLQNVRIEVCNQLISFATKIQYVPARRNIAPFLHASEIEERREAMFDGTAVLPRLLVYSNPGRESSALATSHRAKHSAIEKMLSRLIGEEARLSPLPGPKDVELTIRDTSVPITRMGAGYEQLLIFAMVLVEYADDLLLIEEPENFLHPTLQRRLLELLLERPGECVVTTHSNHLLDIRDPSVAYFRTYADQTSSRLEMVTGYRKYESIWDLGVRPSSLFESNAVVWVEGPSDAIFIRAWLTLVPEAKDLVEGIHFTFAFHAGALLDKFFVDRIGEARPDDQRMVDFCNLHPNFFIVADSDGGPESPFGHDYLARLVPSVAAEALWITHGKEIENYLPEWILQRYLSDRASPRRKSVASPDSDALRWEPFWRLLNHMAGEEFLTECPRKVPFARWAVTQLLEEPQDDPLRVFDLKVSLGRLVDFIRARQGTDRLRLTATTR